MQVRNSISVHVIAVDSQPETRAFSVDKMTVYSVLAQSKSSFTCIIV